MDEALIADAANHEMDIKCLPFIDTVPVTDNAIVDAIRRLGGQSITAIFTSSKSVTAVAALTNKSVNWDIYSLFGATKDQVQKHFPRSTVHATAADSASLAGEITEAGITEAYFFCGDRRMDTIPEKLAGKTDVKQLVVYSTHETAHQVAQSFDGIFFFSPSAVKSFCSVNLIGEETACFAVGNTTAASLQPFTQNIIVAAEASGQAVIKKAKETFGKV